MPPASGPVLATARPSSDQIADEPAVALNTSPVGSAKVAKHGRGVVGCPATQLVDSLRNVTVWMQDQPDLVLGFPVRKRHVFRSVHDASLELEREAPETFAADDRGLLVADCADVDHGGKTVEE